MIDPKPHGDGPVGHSKPMKFEGFFSYLHVFEVVPPLHQIHFKGDLSGGSTTFQQRPPVKPRGYGVSRNPFPIPAPFISQDLRELLQQEVLKREVIEGEKAEAARKKVQKAASKLLRAKKEKEEPEPPRVQPASGSKEGPALPVKEPVGTAE